MLTGRTVHGWWASGRTPQSFILGRVQVSCGFEIFRNKQLGGREKGMKKARPRSVPGGPALAPSPSRSSPSPSGSLRTPIRRGSGGGCRAGAMLSPDCWKSRRFAGKVTFPGCQGRQRGGRTVVMASCGALLAGLTWVCVPGGPRGRRGEEEKDRA